MISSNPEASIHVLPGWRYRPCHQALESIRSTLSGTTKHRNHLGIEPQSVQIVGPRLHHLLSLNQAGGTAVGAPERIPDRMRQLLFDSERIRCAVSATPRFSNLRKAASRAGAVTSVIEISPMHARSFSIKRRSRFTDAGVSPSLVRFSSSSMAIALKLDSARSVCAARSIRATWAGFAPPLTNACSRSRSVLASRAKRVRTTTGLTGGGPTSN